MNCKTFIVILVFNMRFTMVVDSHAEDTDAETLSYELYDLLSLLPVWLSVLFSFIKGGKTPRDAGAA